MDNTKPYFIDYSKNEEKTLRNIFAKAGINGAFESYGTVNFQATDEQILGLKTHGLVPYEGRHSTPATYFIPLPAKPPPR